MRTPWHSSVTAAHAPRVACAYHCPGPPETYRREKRCPCCRGRLALDRWRHANEVGSQTRTGVCHCSGWPFPHRRGSMWCEHGSPPTDEQMAQRYGWDALEDTS